MTQRSPDSAAVFSIALVLAVVGGSTFSVLPLLTAGAADTLGFSGSQVGVMSLAISVGSGAGALFAGAWVRSVPWPRAALFALGGMLAANSLAMLEHDYLAFVLLQGAVGFFSYSLFCISITILSDRQKVAGSFGVSNAIQVMYQVAAILAGPTLLRVAGFNGILAMLAVLSGVTMFLAPLLPLHGRTVVHDGVTKGLLKPATLIAVIGSSIFYANVGAYWTYVDLMGQARGMTAREVANWLAAGVSAGILGGALAWILGDRFGRVWPLCVSAFLTVWAALLVTGSTSVSAFVLSCLLYFFAWNYSLAYQLAVISEVDATGRILAISGAFGFVGTAGGAGLAAFFVSPGDYRVVSWIVAITVSLGTGLFVLACAINRNAPVSSRLSVVP